MKKESNTKRDELKTYASLKLKRTLKSGGQRRRMLARGGQVILGSGQSEEPEIMVRRDHYMQVRMDVLAGKLQSAKEANLDLTREKLLDSLAPSVERETYRRLLDETRSSARLENAFLQTHSRHPTQAEHKIFKNQTRSDDQTRDSGSGWRESRSLAAAEGAMWLTWQVVFFFNCWAGVWEGWV